MKPENSCRFFRNSECEYFPCHKMSDDSDFNCLFCFCPLYHLEDCGGNYSMRGKIKICTDCKLPHKPKAYDYIIKRLKEVKP
jgi:Zn-finger protein